MMLEEFNSHDFGLTNDPEQYFDTFKNTNSLHPDDPKIVVLKLNVWRVKGIIQISRSIDDVYLKKVELNREPLYTKFLLREPMKRPILSVDPSISVHELQPHDQFVIFASDGLWEHLSNEEAVNIVHKHARSGSAKRLVKAALQEATKKREMRYSDFKKIDRGVRRHFHDDITVVVVFLNSNLVSKATSVKGPNLLEGSLPRSTSTKFHASVFVYGRLFPVGTPSHFDSTELLRRYITLYIFKLLLVNVSLLNIIPSSQLQFL